MDRLERYADLIVRVGANVQPGQTVFVDAPRRPRASSPARSRAPRIAAGARFVDVRYGDPHVRKALIDLAPEEALTDTPAWLLDAARRSAGRRRADHDRRRARARAARRPRPGARRRRRGRPRGTAVRGAERTALIAWTIAAHPTAGQATQIFGEPDVERLWEAVAYTVRLDEPDPVGAWREHVDELLARARAARRTRASTRSTSAAPAPISRSGCSPERAGSAAAPTTQGGISHVANLPTEEIFTSPDWRRTEGSVRSTRPLALGGTVVRDLEITF